MKPVLGRLIGVSMGPGDPDLITRRAWTALSGPARNFSGANNQAPGRIAITRPAWTTPERVRLTTATRSGPNGR